MPKIYLCFVWHMHQPCYKDLVRGEYRLPWTRMHALKDYYGMVKLLGEFPQIRQTFNLVPSLLLQIEEYASGQAVDPFFRLALKPAEDLTEEEVRFVLLYFFQANPAHLIGRYPRYRELYDAWRAADRNYRRALHFFNAAAIRDLQVLSQLAWFDEEFLSGDGQARALAEKGLEYSLEDQQVMGLKQLEILGRVLPVYREFAQSGQIEISATPFYHPILPLVCDSNIAHQSNPNVPLPSRFRYPQDARLQLERSLAYVEQKTGVRPTGLWPSEGSVSDEALDLAAEAGYRWAATDNGVLARTLGHAAGPGDTYRPYRWRKNGRELNMIFRDHYLSDLVGFVYSKIEALEAAADFIRRIRENCAPILAAGRDALVPIILDGENAWEHYPQNGRPFLRELYRRLDAEPGMEAVTVSEALDRVADDPLDHIHPGSWINANFDVWIGFEEDNKAWEMLLHARQAYADTAAGSIPQQDRDLALEELLIAEGSDWNWWYGPHHHSENSIEFDQLYRDHLANVYRALRLTPPAELSRPILKRRLKAVHLPPSRAIHPVVDGEVSSYFEWMGGGSYRVDRRGGSMHGHRFLVKELHYGSNHERLFLRVDFLESEAASLAGMEIRVLLSGSSIRIRLRESAAELLEGGQPGVEAAFQRVLEIAIPFSRLGLSASQPAQLQISVWNEGLPMDSLPEEGWLEISAAGPPEWGG
ncbi:MAG: glycoside hydrolase [Acidobacteria bacterium]|nr:glycoside hydrolase [Acidobacteriota bacterium]